MLMILMMTLAVPIRGGVPPSRASTTRLYLGRREGKGEGVRGRRCERGKGVRGGEREGGINGVMGRVREWEGKERGREGS